MKGIVFTIKSLLACLLFTILVVSQSAYAETLTQDTTLLVGDYSYSEDLVVPSGVTLTIEAGAILRFQQGFTLDVEAGGRLVVNGEINNPITFTSSEQTVNSWSGIHLKGNRATPDDIVINHAIIEYADKGIYINEYGVKATVSHTTVRHNNYGVYIDTAYQSSPNHSYVTFTNGALYDNAQYNYYTKNFRGNTVTTIDASGNWWGSSEPSDIAATIYDKRDTTYAASIDFSHYLLAEGGESIGLSYAGYVTKDSTWSGEEAVLAQPIHVTSGNTLTISSGATLKVAAGAGLVVEGGGKLVIEGSAESPVTFTSDAAVSNSWSGIHLKGNRATPDDIVINHTIIEYADKGIYINEYGVKATVSHTTVRHNNYGVYIDTAYQSSPNHSYVTFTNGALYDNAQYNYYTKNFRGNTVTTIDASGNWWGSSEPSDIAATIYDKRDTTYAASIDFSHYLLAEGGESIGLSYAGYVTKDSTWSGEEAVLAQPIHVTSGNTLTISSGATLKVAAGAGLVVEGGGKLVIEGSAESPVTFTSDAAVSNSWSGIHLKGNRATPDDIVINHAIIEYADKGIYINEYGVKATVNHTTVRHNNYGVYIDTAYQSAPYHSYVTFKDGALYDNTQYNYYTKNFRGNTVTTIDASGNWWGSSEPSDIAATIYDKRDTTYAASIDFSHYLLAEDGESIGLSYAGYVTEDSTWSGEEAVLAQPIHVTSGNTLTISSGATLKAAAGAGLVVEAGGKLIIEGSAESPVTFTSDAAVSNSWSGIHLKGNRATPDDIVINHAIIEYADKGIYINEYGVKATVSHTTVRHNNYGVYIDTAYQNAPYHSYVTFKDGALYDNAQYNYYTKNFRGNTVTTIVATGNWWGSSDLNEISNSIWDINDSSYTASINFASFLTSEGGSPLDGTHLMGNITSEQRWSFNDGKALGDITVKSNGSLTVEAGTHLSFLGNNKLIVENGASLTIIGTTDNPVTFTSGKEGKTASDWGGIEVKSNTNITIANAVIEYADKGIAFIGSKSSGRVTNSVIKNNRHGVHVNAENQSLANHPTPIVTNNSIHSNTEYNYYTQKFGSASSRTLNAKGNYWGVTDAASIATSVYDNSDSSASPIVDIDFARPSEISTVIADAGEDITGYGTVETQLSGTGVSNVAITEHTWQQYLGDQVTLNNANSSRANFTVPDVTNDKLYSFIYTVTDANDISASDKLNVVVKPFAEYNKAPVVDESQQILVQSNEAVSVTLSATDEENDPLTFAWEQTSGESITLASVDTDTLSFTMPEHEKNAVYRFKLTVSDVINTVERTVVVAVKASETVAGTYYYHNDHLGTPQIMTNDSAAVVWEANYTPFGEADITVETVTNNLRFAGQYYDHETGLHYNYFRDYDPELGRYIQSDPIGLAGGINTYAYVEGNPINYTDPLGLWSTEAHTYMIRLLGKQRGWSDRRIRAVIAGSRYADNPLFGKQSAGNSHLHAMTSDKNSSKSAACAKANSYINNRMNYFSSMSKRGGSDNWAANSMLGQALHTIMDNRSPAHAGFQMWDNSQIGRHGNDMSPLPFGAHTEEDLSALLARPDLMQQMLNDMK